MLIKTSELTGAALDWAVAKCEGHESRCPWLLEKEGYAAWQSYENAWGNPLPNYSTGWTQGGPIIEREKISIMEECNGTWMGSIGGCTDLDMPLWQEHGPTPLIAAMRCYVASELGDTVDIPDELR